MIADFDFTKWNFPVRSFGVYEFERRDALNEDDESGYRIPIFIRRNVELVFRDWFYDVLDARERCWWHSFRGCFIRENARELNLI